MKLVIVTDEDEIPAWLFPGALPWVQLGASMEADGVTHLPELWRIIGTKAQTVDTLIHQSSGCSTGFPHDAPDDVLRLHPDFVSALAAVADHERWRVARDWTAARLGRRPNQQEEARGKEHLKRLSELAREAAATVRMIVFVEQYR